MSKTKGLIFLVFLVLIAPGGVAQEENGTVVDRVLESMVVKENERFVESESNYKIGLSLYKKRKFEDAEEYFEKALRLNPNHKAAKNYIIKIRSVLGQRKIQVSSQGEWIEQNERVDREERLFELEKEVNIAKGNYEINAKKKWESPNEKKKALEENLAEFRKCIDLANNLNTKRERDAVIKLITVFLEDIQKEIVNLKSQITAMQRDEANKLLLEELQVNQRYVKNKIKSLIEAVERAIENYQYEEAIKLAEDVLAVDPLHKRAKKLRAQAEELRHRKQVAKTSALTVQERTRRFLGIQKSFIPYSATVVYPEDWEEIKLRQKKSLQRQEVPEWKRKLDRQLETQVSFTCHGLPLQEVLTTLSSLSGVNFFLDPVVLQERDEDSLFVGNLKLEKIKLRNLLNHIVVTMLGLKYDLRHDVVFVTNAQGARDSLILDTYDVQHFLSPKQNFSPPNLSLGSISETTEEAISFEEDFEIEEGETLSGETIVELITTSIKGDWGDEEAGIKILFLESGAILIKNTLAVHNQVIELLQTLRKTSSLQVEVESRFLEISDDFFRELGFDWMGLDNTEKVAGSDPGFVNSDNGDDLRAMIFNNIQSNPSTAQLGFYLEHSILSNFQAKVLFRALEQDSSTTKLIAPRVLMVNNVNAYIRLTRTAHYISGYGGEGAGVVPEIATVDEGQLLSVTATVSSDRRYITLQLQPDFQTLSFRPPATIVGSFTAASLADFATEDFSYSVDLPVINKQRVRTTAVIPDGGILVLGGVATAKDNYTNRGVPFLSSIPFLGRLFKSDSKSSRAEDLMMFVKARIVIFDEIEAEL